MEWLIVAIVIVSAYLGIENRVNSLELKVSAVGTSMNGVGILIGSPFNRSFTRQISIFTR